VDKDRTGIADPWLEAPTIPLILIFIKIMALGFICADAPINSPYFKPIT
jgi:hypothetical protein